MATKNTNQKTDAGSTRAIAAMASMHEPHCASMDWLARIQLASEVFLEINPERRGRRHLAEATRLAEFARTAVQQGNAEAAAVAAMGALQCAWLAEVSEGRTIINTGVAMTRGRKNNTAGPIRKKIAALLKKDPTLENPKLWELVKRNLPRGWTGYDNREGKYFEGPDPSKPMGWRRFINVCGEERKKIGS
jgi:hypothetical protein